MTLTAAYDASEASWGGLRESEQEQLRAWLLDHGIDPREVYRFEIHVIGRPLIRVFAFDRDESGNCYCPADHDHRAEGEQCELATCEPRAVFQKTPPPVQPWSLHQ